MAAEQMSKGRKVIVFIILSLGAGLVFFTPCLKFSFYDQMMEVLGINDVQINLLYSVYGAVNLAMYPISGFLGDRIPARTMIAFSMFAYAALDVVYAFTTNFPLLIAIHAGCGILAAGAFWCPYLKAIRMLGDESVQSKLFGMSEATRGLAQAVIGFAALALFNLAATSAGGFKSMLILTSVTYGVMGVLSLIFLPKEDMKATKAQTEGNGKASPFAGMAKALKNSGTWIVILLIFAGFCFWLLANTFMTTYSVRVLGISQSLASTLGIIRSYLLVAVAGFGGGWLMDKFTYKGKTFFAIFGISIALLLGIMLSSKMVTFCLILTIILTLITNVVKATYWSTLGQAGISVEETAAASGVISLIAYIPESFLTIIGGSMISKADAAGNIAAGFNQVFILMIAFCAIAIVASILLYKKAKKVGF